MSPGSFFREVLESHEFRLSDIVWLLRAFLCRSTGISETAFHLFSIACLCRISETDSGYVRLDADLSHHW